MTATNIPSWAHRGLLPSFQGKATDAALRSPYRVAVADLVHRFGTSSSRLDILEGLLGYREALQGLGIASGFQRVNGSFAEHVEGLENRDPNDVDVVTFFELSLGESQQSLVGQNPDLFHPKRVKERFQVDAYLVQLDGQNCPAPLERALYWYSLWVHRRDLTWKGFVQIPLASAGEGIRDRIGELRFALEGG